MADNVPITAGSGTNVATDDIGGVHYQRVKNTWGADGTAVDVSATDPFPVNTNALQLRTYRAVRVVASGAAPAAAASPAAVANTPKILVTGHHTASDAQLVRIHLITVGAVLGTAVTYVYELYRTNSAPTGGATFAVQEAQEGDTATTMIWTYQSTLAIGTALVGAPLAAYSIPSTTTGHAAFNLYDWNESGPTKPLIIRASTLEGICVTSRTTTATAPDPVITVVYTEV